MAGTLSSGTLGSGTLGNPGGLPPDAIIEVGPPDGRDATAHFEFTSDDPAATFESQLDGGQWVVASSPLDLTDLGPGSHRLLVRAINASGTISDPAEWTWRIIGQRAWTPLGLQILNELPAWAQTDPSYQAIAHVSAKESELMRERLGAVRDSLIPARRGVLLLDAWEVLMKLPQRPAGVSDAERWDRVQARLRQAIQDPSGLSWVARVTEQIGGGWTYVEEDPNVIRVTVPWKPGSERFLLAERVLDRMKPAAWRLIIESAEGFVLDRSKLDKESFH